MIDSKDNIDLSQAITIYLKHHPGENNEEFDSFFGPAMAPPAREKVRSVLDQAMKVEVDWATLSLVEGGEIVKSAMRDEYPQLSPQALAAIGHYYTYLMR